MPTLLHSGLSITECAVVQDCQSVLKWGHELDQNNCAFLVDYCSKCFMFR